MYLLALVLIIVLVLYGESPYAEKRSLQHTVIANVDIALSDEGVVSVREGDLKNTSSRDSTSQTIILE